MGLILFLSVTFEAGSMACTCLVVRIQMPDSMMQPSEKENQLGLENTVHVYLGNSVL